MKAYCQHITRTKVLNIKPTIYTRGNITPVSISRQRDVTRTYAKWRSDLQKYNGIGTSGPIWHESIIRVKNMIPDDRDLTIHCCSVVNALMTILRLNLKQKRFVGCVVDFHWKNLSLDRVKIADHHSRQLRRHQWLQEAPVSGYCLNYSYCWICFRTWEDREVLTTKRSSCCWGW